MSSFCLSPTVDKSSGVGVVVVVVVGTEGGDNMGYVIVLIIGIAIGYLGPKLYVKYSKKAVPSTP